MLLYFRAHRKTDRSLTYFNILYRFMQHGTLRLQQMQHPRPAHDGELRSEGRAGFKHGDPAPAFHQIFGQLQPDQATTDDDDVAGNGHPQFAEPSHQAYVSQYLA